MNGYSTFPKTQSLASPTNGLVSYPGHSLDGGLTPLQKCSQYILQSQLTKLMFQIRFLRKFQAAQLTSKLFINGLHVLFIIRLVRKDEVAVHKNVLTCDI